MDNVSDILLDVTIPIAGFIALSDIQSILAIIILIIQALLILYKLVKKCYNKIKNKNYDIEVDVNQAIDELKDLNSKNNKEDKDV